MKLVELEHILRASKDICKDSEFVIIGSQSLHGKFPDLPDKILVSMEVDLIAKTSPDATRLLNAIGVESPFHVEFGYYADPVDFETAILPHDWRNRLVNLKTSELAMGVKAYCLHPHDLAVAKIAAWREKDRVLLKYLLKEQLIKPDAVLRLIEKIKQPRDYRADMAKRFTAMLKSVRPQAR